MVFHERAAWAGLIAAIPTFAVYGIVVLQLADGGDPTLVDWLPVMLWTIGGGAALTAIVTIVWGIFAGIRDPQAGASDMRDEEISRLGGRVEHAFLIVAGLGVIVLCGIGADVFWIANTMFAGFAISALVGGIARVVAYRRGLV